MSEEFKPGDEVRHKSGGSKIIVTKIDDDEVECEWIDKEGNRRVERFLATSLKKWTPRSGGVIGSY